MWATRRQKIIFLKKKFEYFHSKNWHGVWGPLESTPETLYLKKIVFGAVQPWAAKSHCQFICTIVYGLLGIWFEYPCYDNSIFGLRSGLGATGYHFEFFIRLKRALNIPLLQWFIFIILLQFMFDESYEVGCGYTVCPSMVMNDGSTWKNVMSFWCNYNP